LVFYVNSYISFQLDLDSIISSLLFAYWSTEFLAENDTTLYIPLIKVPHADLSLRPELDFVLNKAGIDRSLLVCIDDLVLDRDSAQLILVDHNQLTPPFDAAWRVMGVLDHHVDEHHEYPNMAFRQITMVGSCVTLVLDHFFKQFGSDWVDPTTAILAMAPLLVDTIELKWELGRTHALDVEIYQVLKQVLQQQPQLYSSNYFQEIEKVKSQVDGMSSKDILRRDYKQFEVNGYHIGTSAVTWHFAAWAKRDSAQQIADTANAFAKNRQLDMEVIFTAFDHGANGGYRRQLAVLIKNPKLKPVQEALEQDNQVDLTPIDALNKESQSDIVFYDQNNVKMSRKQVWPLLKQLISKI
jgi:exopolyphosphatase